MASNRASQVWTTHLESGIIGLFRGAELARESHSPGSLGGTYKVVGMKDAMATARVLHLEGEGATGGDAERNGPLNAKELIKRYKAGERNFRGARMEGIELNDVNLSGIKLNGAILRKASFRGACLAGAKLRGANLYKADLQGADLRKANLREANLDAADLRKADLGKAVLQRAHLNDTDLRKANLYKAKLNHADLSGATVTDEQLADAKTLKGATLPDGTRRK